MWYQGLLEPSYLETLIATLILTHITIVSVTIYLHRYSAHRALELNPVLKHFFRFWLWLTTGMQTKGWTAVHRKHHALCETTEDPHSPVQLGLKRVLWRGAELYQAIEQDPVIAARYGKGTPDDWIERNIYTHDNIGLTLMLLVDLALFGVIGLSVWAIQMVWIPFFAAGVINGVGHAHGYRNFECPDAARNVFPWGILIGGEELHNNHHTYPNSAKLSVKWWEFDIGWFYIKLLSMLGLAQARQRAPIAKQVPGKKLIDMDTAWAAINDRFRIMAQYSQTVVDPLVKNERRNADRSSRNLFKQARSLMCREHSLMDERSKAQVSELLEHNATLKRIYEMRRELEAIWQHGSRNISDSMHALSDWCTQAEESGIEVLHEFSDYLRSYTMPLATN